VAEEGEDEVSVAGELIALGADVEGDRCRDRYRDESGPPPALLVGWPWAGHRAKHGPDRSGSVRCGPPARYQLFLSEGKGSWGFRYLKNHPFEAVATKPKPARTMTVTRTPTANVIMLPPWS
jgi:hypothetical protein